MSENIVNANWNVLNSKVRGWWEKRSSDQLAQLERQREKNIAILKERYGYSQEKAESELEQHYSKVNFG